MFDSVRCHSSSRFETPWFPTDLDFEHPPDPPGPLPPCFPHQRIQCYDICLSANTKSPRRLPTRLLPLQRWPCFTLCSSRSCDGRNRFYWSTITDFRLPTHSITPWDPDVISHFPSILFNGVCSDAVSRAYSEPTLAGVACVHCSYWVASRIQDIFTPRGYHSR